MSFRFPFSALVLLAAMTVGACAGPEGSQTEALKDVEWVLRDMPGATLVGPAPTATFDTEGRVYGFGGCNRFTGGFTLDGENLSFTPLASTRMACVSANVEDAYLDRLALVARYRIENDDLVLGDAEGNALLIFRR